MKTPKVDGPGIGGTLRPRHPAPGFDDALRQKLEEQGVTIGDPGKPDKTTGPQPFESPPPLPPPPPPPPAPREPDE